jgi:hypothetical protein
MVLMLGVRSPQSIACGVDASVSRIELYNSDRIASFVFVLYVKFDPGVHIDMHLVCFFKNQV